MIRTLSSYRLSRASLVPILVAAVVTVSWMLVPEGHSQAPATTTSNVALNGLLTKLKTQQEQLAANQTKIEAQTAQLKEELRQAKIYGGRGGSRR